MDEPTQRDIPCALLGGNKILMSHGKYPMKKAGALCYPKNMFHMFLVNAGLLECFHNPPNSDVRT